jgi:hypothetical protein
MAFVRNPDGQTISWVIPSKNTACQVVVQMADVMANPAILLSSSPSQVIAVQDLAPGLQGLAAQFASATLSRTCIGGFNRAADGTPFIVAFSSAPGTAAYGAVISGQGVQAIRRMVDFPLGDPAAALSWRSIGLIPGAAAVIEALGPRGLVDTTDTGLRATIWDNYFQQAQTFSVCATDIFQQRLKQIGDIKSVAIDQLIPKSVDAAIDTMLSGNGQGLETMGVLYCG